MLNMLLWQPEQAENCFRVVGKRLAVNSKPVKYLKTFFKKKIIKTHLIIYSK